MKSFFEVWKSTSDKKKHNGEEKKHLFRYKKKKHNGDKINSSLISRFIEFVYFKVTQRTPVAPRANYEEQCSAMPTCEVPFSRLYLTHGVTIVSCMSSLLSFVLCGSRREDGIHG